MLQMLITLAQNGVVIRIKDGRSELLIPMSGSTTINPLPPDEELVIYEMHVGDFSGGEDDPYARGKYKHVVEKLDYLYRARDQRD